MRKYLILLSCCLFLCKSQAQDMLFYPDAIQLALEKNFDIRIAKSEQRISNNNYTRGNSGFLPAILWTGSRNYSLQNVKQEFITGSENDKSNAKSNTWNTGIDFSWTLFDGTKMFTTYKKLAILKELGGMEVKMAVENAIFNTTIAYYKVVLEKNRLLALDSTILLSKDRLQLAKDKYEVGKAPKFEFLSAELDYNSDYTLVLKQREALRLAKYDLNEIITRSPEIDFDVPNSLSIDTSFNIEELKNSVFIRNTALIEAITNGRVMELEKKELNALRLPQLDLNLGYNYSNLSSQAGFLLSNKVHGLNYGVSASWWIFDGNGNKLQRQNLQVEKESQALRIEKLKFNVLKELEENYLVYSNNLKFIKLYKKNLSLALENADIALVRYKLGKSSFIEFREAQIKIVNAYSLLFNTVYQTKIAELNMLLLSGQLLNSK